MYNNTYLSTTDKVINNLMISFCSDIHSVSNVLTSEFQAAIFLKCQDETEQSLVYYLCQGHGLLLLQMLCILAHKVWGETIYVIR